MSEKLDTQVIFMLSLIKTDKEVGKKMVAERSDKLRKRPNIIRYHFLAVGDTSIHVGLSHAGLAKAAKNDNISSVYLSDVVTKKITKVDLVKFLEAWREHYQDPKWEYVEK